MKIIKITKEKITLEVCYNNNRINKELEEERADPKYRPTRRTVCRSYKSTDYKFRAEDEKYTLCAS